MATMSSRIRIQRLISEIAPPWTIGVVSALTFLPPVPAHGHDGTARDSVSRSEVVLRLPKIPSLETTPWLEWAPYRHGLKVDTLQLPRSPFEDATACNTPPTS